jgi:hypothetical protein
LKARNHELYSHCKELGLTEDQIPKVDEEEVNYHLESFKHFVSENHRLKADLQVLSKDLAVTQATLSQSGMIRLGGPGGPGAGAGGAAGVQGVDEGGMRRCAEVMAELQNNIQLNTDLIWQHRNQIRQLESDISSVRQQLSRVPPAQPGSQQNLALSPDKGQQLLAQKNRELEEISAECAEMEFHLAAELERPSPPANNTEADGKEIQRLQVEHEALEEEICNLQQKIFQKQREEPAMPPGTGKLLAERERLEAQLVEDARRAIQAQDFVEELARNLRQEALVLRESLEGKLQEQRQTREELHKLEFTREHELEEKAAAEQHFEEQQVRRDLLIKEGGRQQQKIENLDVKIRLYQTELEDIRRRAINVRQTVPEAPGGEAGTTDERVAQLQDLVQRRQQQVQQMKQQEEKLRNDQLRAQEALRNVQAEAAALERQAQLMKDRMAPAQAALDEATYYQSPVYSDDLATARSANSMKLVGAPPYFPVQPQITGSSCLASETGGDFTSSTRESPVQSGQLA